MRRLLFITPHFPPDSSAGTHRGRLLAPHLEKFGWETTVLTADPSGLESRADWRLAESVPASLSVERAATWSPQKSRRFGFGDLGLRSLQPFAAEALRLGRARQFDLAFITIYPAYTALLGPFLRRRLGLDFVIDYQDPWVSEWGRSVGPGGRPNLRSRLSRAVAGTLEPFVLKRARGITAVSRGTVDGIVGRLPWAGRLPFLELPIGIEPHDFVVSREANNPIFDRNDGNIHLSYVGTLLPLGFETLRAFLRGVRVWCDRRPELASQLRIHFVGTSNQSSGSICVVEPIAAELTLQQIVSEHPARLDYFDALRVLQDSDLVITLGSSERHYTASKIFPALLSRRRIVAVYHEASSVVELLRGEHLEGVEVVTYSDVDRAETRIDDIADALDRSMLGGDLVPPTQLIESVSAESLAKKLAAFFDAVVTEGG